MAATDDLPDDLPTLTAIIARQRVEIASQQTEIAHLKPWIAKLHRQQFGRCSERTGKPLNQLELQLEKPGVGAVERDVRIEPVPLYPAL